MDSSKTGDVTSVDFIKSRRSPFKYYNVSLQSWFRKIIKYSTFSNMCQYFLTAGMTIMTPRSREVPIQWFWLPLAPSIQTSGTRSIFYFSSSSSSCLPSRQESVKQHFFHFEILNLFRQWYPQKMSQLTSTRRWQRERATNHLISIVLNN